MTHETILLLTIGLAVVLLAVGAGAWWRRSKRDIGLAAPTGDIPAGARVRETFAVLYVATTRHDEPLERLAIRGLGFRSRADITVTDRGLGIDLVGQPGLFLPVSSIAEVGQATVAIDRVVEPDGLVRLVWRTGDHLVDSYFRSQDSSSRAVADAIAGILPAISPTSTSTTPTGIDA